MRCSSVLCAGLATPAGPFACKRCRQPYCSKACAANDRGAGHSSMCEQRRREQAERVEATCPFVKRGRFLECSEAERAAPKVDVEKRYEVVEEAGRLGKGSYGEVVLMRDKGDGSFVAAKVIKKCEIRDERERAAIFNEISIQKRVEHENVVGLLGHGEDSSRIYMVMECVRRGNLFGHLRRKGSFGEREAFFFFAQACSAVHFLHSHCIVHRDIKPENLLLSHNGLLKLCDFGCAALEGENANYCGTVEYMAPEIILGKRSDRKADVWSLGVLLYEMLKGYVPFYGKRQASAGGSKVRFVSAKEDVRELIEDMLNPEPELRPDVWEVFLYPWMKRMQQEFGITETNEEIAVRRQRSPEAKLVGNNYYISNTRANIAPISRTLLYRKQSEGIRNIARKRDFADLPNQLNERVPIQAKTLAANKKPINRTEAGMISGQAPISLANLKNEPFKISSSSTTYKLQHISIKNHTASASTVDDTTIQKVAETVQRKEDLKYGWPADAAEELRQGETDEGTAVALKSSDYTGSTEKMRQSTFARRKQGLNSCQAKAHLIKYNEQNLLI